MSTGTPITITVAGHNGSGKTAISMLIKEALMLNGIVAIIEDQDGPLPPAGTSSSRLASLRERRTVVKIQQRQLARGAHQ